MKYFYIKDCKVVLENQMESSSEIEAERIIDLKRGYKNLNNLIQNLQDGDLMYIYELNVFGSYKSIIEKIKKILEKGADIITLKKPQILINNKNIGDILPVIEYFSNIKLEVDKTRRKKGLEKAKKKGKSLGRPKIVYPHYWDMVYIQYRTKDISAKEAWESLNLKKSTFYNLIKKYERERNIKQE
ncbi:recombinase family protein [Clostridium baratii]|uniref:recombinase family protein n=1 Tax=Clostridium baratii TaxID=1561 RepID=UPI0005F2CADD|nr:recombinase family protein [Clostridium baratii]KJU72396.1 hypothetical protein UC77_04495 [Clostridium baratii]